MLCHRLIVVTKMAVTQKNVAWKLFEKNIHWG